MDLWIISQNKLLIKKVNHEIYYNERNGHNHIIVDGDVLGSYKTKERALEVLSEIQKLILPKYIISNFPDDRVKDLRQVFNYNYDFVQSNGNINIKQLGNYVYLLPKD